MDELIQQLVAKAGLTEDQAAKAVEVTKDYIMSKLPPQMSGIVDNFFAANGGKEDDFLS